MHRPQLSKSTSTADATSMSTTTSVVAAAVSQPELAAGQRQQGSFAGVLATVHTPESTHIPAADQQFAGLRLLAEASASQVDPFEALATHRTVTFDEAGEYQEQPDDSLSLSNESSEPVEDIPTKFTTSIPENEILPSINDHFQRTLSGTVPEAFLTAVAGNPQIVTDDYLAKRKKAKKKPTPTVKWVILTGDKEKPFKCGYEGCGKHYPKRQSLNAHFRVHINDSRLRCYSGDCAGLIRYRDSQALTRHIHANHTLERPYQCEDCGIQFRRPDHLRLHRIKSHSIEDEKKIPKQKTTKKKPNPTEKWVILTGDDEKPFKCGYEGCDKHYPSRQALYAHFRKHNNDSRFRCYFGDCAGLIRYRDSQRLTRHIHANHTLEKPYQCEDCGIQFRRPDHLRSHRRKLHSIEDEKKIPKRKKK